MFIRNLIYSLLLCFLLNSCSWFSDPDLPKQEIPSKFSSDSSNSDLKNLPYLAWWQQFNDSNLNNLIESGLSNNLDIQIALSNLDQAQGQLKQIQLSWIPFVNLYAGYSSNPAFGDIGTFYGAFPGYTLNIAKLVEQQKQAQYNISIQKAMIDGVRLTLIGQITSSYLTLIAQQEQTKLLHVLDKDLLELIDLSRHQIQIGLKDNIDIAKLLVQEKMVQAQLDIVKHNMVFSQNALNYLINQNPGSINTNNNFAKLDFSKYKPGSIPATVLQNRPDLLIAEYTLKSAHTGVGVAYSSLFPNIQLDQFFGAGSGDGSFATPNTFAPMTDAYINWGINPSVFGQIEAQKGAYQARVYQYIQTVRKILRDVDNSYSANEQFSQSYVNTYKAWVDLDDKFNLQQGLYNSGIMDYPELLSNKLDIDNLALTLNQSKLQEAISLVSLYQELAGGYKYTQDSVSKH